jgi:hypothetical protein
MDGIENFLSMLKHEKLDVHQFTVPEDIVEALKAESGARTNFLSFPDLYRRVRIGCIEDARKDVGEFERPLSNFAKKTAAMRSLETGMMGEGFRKSWR